MMHVETESLIFFEDGDLEFILIQPAEGQEQDDTTMTIDNVDSPLMAEDSEDTIFIPSREVDRSSLGSLQLVSHEMDSKPPKQIRMVVSSQTMMMVSPVFRAMLKPDGFSEGKDLAAGRAQIPLPDDSASAWKILLDICHHRTKLVPRTVDLHTMKDIAILVDKYRLQEAVVLYVDLWIETLKESLPQSFCPEISPWLSIAWVFKLPFEFKHLTRIAQRETWGKLDSGELPIPDIIIRNMEDTRQQAISDALNELQRVIKKYQKAEVNCHSNLSNDPATRLQKNLACDGLVLGSLLKSAAINELWPVPLAPYEGLRLVDVICKMRCLEPTAICDALHNVWSGGKQPSPSHGVKSKIVAQLNALEARVDGMNLEDFC